MCVVHHNHFTIKIRTKFYIEIDPFYKDVICRFDPLTQELEIIKQQKTVYLFVETFQEADNIVKRVIKGENKYDIMENTIYFRDDVEEFEPDEKNKNDFDELMKEYKEKNKHIFRKIKLENLVETSEAPW